jgi:PadR family transcriptional regulator PadR
MGEQAQLLPGTLDLLILKAVSLGPLHGYGVLLRIGQISGSALLIEQGALYPALFRLVRQGLLKASWGISDNNRRAKFYELTTAGRKRLREEQDGWNRLAVAMSTALSAQSGGSMNFYSYFQSLVENVFRRAEVSAEVDAELRSHIEHRADDLVRDGLNRAEAERRARIEFGARERYKEESYEALGGSFFHSFWGDVRFALRVLRKSRGFTSCGSCDAGVSHWRELRGFCGAERIVHSPAECTTFAGSLCAAARARYVHCAVLSRLHRFAGSQPEFRWIGCL